MPLWTSAEASWSLFHKQNQDLIIKLCASKETQQNRFDVFLDLIGIQLILEAAAQQNPREPPEASRADLNRSFNWASIFPHTHGSALLQFLKLGLWKEKQKDKCIEIGFTGTRNLFEAKSEKHFAG